MYFRGVNINNTRQEVNLEKFIGPRPPWILQKRKNSNKHHAPLPRPNYDIEKKTVMKHHPFLHVKIDRQVLSQNQGRFQDLEGGKYNFIL